MLQVITELLIFIFPAFANIAETDTELWLGLSPVQLSWIIWSIVVVCLIIMILRWLYKYPTSREIEIYKEEERAAQQEKNATTIDIPMTSIETHQGTVLPSMNIPEAEPQMPIPNVVPVNEGNETPGTAERRRTTKSAQKRF